MHPRDELLATMDRIYRRGLTTTSGGNLSIRGADESIWITPASIDKGRLTAETIVRVGPDGTVDGEGRPSSELPFHRAAYEARPACRAIVHAHPAALVAFSVCHAVPDTAILPLIAEACGRVVSVPYALSGTDRLADVIGGAFARGADAVILENHGVVVAGRDLADAFRRFEALERTARIIAAAGAIGSPRAPRRASREQRGRRAVAPRPASPPPPDGELAGELIAFSARACRRSLMTSSFGTTSARSGKDSFVIVAPGADREALERTDLEVVDAAAPPSEDPIVRLHRAVYAAHPGVSAVITAAPIHATAFAVTDVALDARAVSESLIVLRRVVRIPHDVATDDPARAAAMVSLERPVALLESVGVLAVGRSVHQAFDRLDVLEATAHALAIARSVGEAITLGDTEVRELEERFPVSPRTGREADPSVR